MICRFSSFVKVKSTQVFIRDCSMVHPVALICLCGKDVKEIRHETRPGMLLSNDEALLTFCRRVRQIFVVESKAVEILSQFPIRNISKINGRSV